jgi:hypothetical protein
LPALPGFIFPSGLFVALPGIRFSNINLKAGSFLPGDI